MNKHRENKGFTLLELSIVVVVIGLIIVAVTVGYSLVKQAKLSRLITELQKYDTSINLFRV